MVSFCNKEREAESVGEFGDDMFLRSAESKCKYCIVSDYTSGKTKGSDDTCF